MKLIVSQKELSKHLDMVLKAVPSRPTHPVLSCVLFHAHESGIVRLRAFDLSLGIQVEFQAEVKEDAYLAIPAKLFADVASRLSGDLTITAKGTDITIKSATGKYEMQALKPDDFPELPSVDGDAINISASALLAGIKPSLFAVSTDEMKQILTGINIAGGDGNLGFHATDGHRMSIISIEGVEAVMNLTIPTAVGEDAGWIYWRGGGAV
jgi:DNA polymerase III subunit beta